MKKVSRVPVRVRALYQRINRKLRHDGRTLKIARSPSAIASVGKYFIIGEDGVSDQAVDLEKFGRRLGVLSAWEDVIAD